MKKDCYEVEIERHGTRGDYRCFTGSITIGEKELSFNLELRRDVRYLFRNRDNIDPTSPDYVDAIVNFPGSESELNDLQIQLLKALLISSARDLYQVQQTSPNRTITQDTLGLLENILHLSGVNVAELKNKNENSMKRTYRFPHNIERFFTDF